MQGILCWSVSAMLLSFLCLTHLGVMLCLSVGARVSPFVAPAALLASLVAGDWIARREGLRGSWRIVPPAITLTVLALALFLAASFFDFGWDGLWYHQTAVYQMAHGWNPLQDPMHGFVPGHVEPMLRHYSKEPWYVALALLETTHNIEWAKAGTWIALAAMFFTVFGAGLDFAMRRRTALLIAALVSLNPVAVCESASYLVDGLMVSFLACFVAALFRWLHRSSPVILVVLMASAVLCINAKLTGLVYLCFACAAGGLYALIKRRDLLVRFTAVQIAAILLGVVVFGFNPYVTNTVHRGNPLYPLLGTTANPGIGTGTQNPIDRYETPSNLVGRNRIVRLGYAIFSRPGAQPVFGGENARLMWPFDVGWKDFNMFRIHGVRISGFGPLFSGAFLVSLVLLCVALIRPGVPREVLLLFTGTIVASLLISTHTWWARLGPQLWWLPVIAVIAGLRRSDSVGQASRLSLTSTHGELAREDLQLSAHQAANDPLSDGDRRDACPTSQSANSRSSVSIWRAVHWTAWALAALLFVNAALVAVAHFRWEIEATRTLHEQMAFLRQQGEVEVDFQYFREPFGERLRAAGVTFRAVRRLQCDDPMELTSVAPGYRFPVRACVHEKHPQSTDRTSEP